MAVRKNLREFGKEADPCHAIDIDDVCGEETGRAEGERGGVDGEEGEEEGKDVCFWYMATLDASCDETKKEGVKMYLVLGAPRRTRTTCRIMDPTNVVIQAFAIICDNSISINN